MRQQFLGGSSIGGIDSYHIVIDAQYAGYLNADMGDKVFSGCRWGAS
jgi:hypothetical protein